MLWTESKVFAEDLVITWDLPRSSDFEERIPFV